VDYAIETGTEYDIMKHQEGERMAGVDFYEGNQSTAVNANVGFPT
jgi:hypothetical protein